MQTNQVAVSLYQVKSHVQTARKSRECFEHGYLRLQTASRNESLCKNTDSFA